MVETHHQTRVDIAILQDNIQSFISETPAAYSEE
jgi:hypothetical protein